MDDETGAFLSYLGPGVVTLCAPLRTGEPGHVVKLDAQEPGGSCWNGEAICNAPAPTTPAWLPLPPAFTPRVRICRTCLILAGRLEYRYRIPPRMLTLLKLTEAIET